MPYHRATVVHGLMTDKNTGRQVAVTVKTPFRWANPEVIQVMVAYIYNLDISSCTIQHKLTHETEYAKLGVC